MRTLRTVAVLLPFMLAACAESSSGPGKPTNAPRLTVLAGSGLEDTVAVQPARPITLEFRDRAGQLAPGIAVTLTPKDTLYEGKSGAGDVFLLRPGSPIMRKTLTDTTNTQGRLVVTILMGFRAGVAGLVVTAPSIGVTDTIPLKVFPAPPVRVASSPADTAAYVGGSYVLRAFAVDRYGNRTDTIARSAAYSSLTPGVTVSGSGQVTAVSIGRQRLLARIGALSDTVSVSVVPAGTIAAHQAPTGIGQSFHVVTVNLDGSGLRQIASESVPWVNEGGDIRPGHSMRPTWDAGGQRLAYQDVTGETLVSPTDSAITRIFVADLTAVARRLVQPTNLIAQRDPVFSSDGQRVYFRGQRGTFNYQIWRVNVDGTGLEAVTPATNSASAEHPAVSPNGAELAYSTGTSIRIRTLATGTERVLPVVGRAPRWSPDGQQIAYVNTMDDAFPGELRIVRADGTQDRSVVTGSPASFDPVISWSPDGRYIVIAENEYGSLDLIVVATGEKIPLPFGSRLSAASWRPGSQP